LLICHPHAFISDVASAYRLIEADTQPSVHDLSVQACSTPSNRETIVTYTSLGARMLASNLTVKKL
jgi:hypothetical protein